MIQIHFGIFDAAQAVFITVSIISLMLLLHYCFDTAFAITRDDVMITYYRVIIVIFHFTHHHLLG